MMESLSSLQGFKELTASGTPVDTIEGDGDNTLISRIKKDLNIEVKKRFDKNHILKNITKSLYTLAEGKTVKISKMVILHLKKCLSYCFARNVNDFAGMKKNLQAIIPHNFGDHQQCRPTFCGFKRNPTEVYQHRSLPYKVALKDDALKKALNDIFEPLINRATVYANLGSSQQCEHANKEVALRAPKSHHYGDSESLDHRVAATAAFINEGRKYLPEVYDLSIMFASFWFSFVEK